MLSVERKAIDIMKKISLIFDDKLRLGIIDHEEELRLFNMSYCGASCSCCGTGLSSEDAYWYMNSCERCEKEKFLDAELKKLPFSCAADVRNALLSNYSTIRLVH